MTIVLLYRSGATEEFRNVEEPPPFFRRAKPTDKTSIAIPMDRARTPEAIMRDVTFIRTTLYTDRGHLIYVEHS